MKVINYSALLILSSRVVADTPWTQCGYDGHWYKVFTQSVTWDTANNDVTEMAPIYGQQPHLATITSSEENLCIHNIQAVQYGHQGWCWVGGYQHPDSRHNCVEGEDWRDCEPCGGWEWVNDEGPIPINLDENAQCDGVDVTTGYENWYPGEPNNCCWWDHPEGIGIEHWMSLRADGTFGDRWNDDRDSMNYIVEIDSDTLVIKNCDTEVLDPIMEIENCVTLLSSPLADCGGDISCITNLLNQLMADGTITEDDKKSIMGCFLQDDTDQDGVLDVDDFCPDTTRDSIDEENIKPGHYAWIDDDDILFTVGGKKDREEYTMEDTGGCSCFQILTETGAGKGQFKHGCSPGTMKNWIEYIEKLHCW